MTIGTSLRCAPGAFTPRKLIANWHGWFVSAFPTPYSDCTGRTSPAGSGRNNYNFEAPIGINHIEWHFLLCKARVSELPAVGFPAATLPC